MSTAVRSAVFVAAFAALGGCGPRAQPGRADVVYTLFAEGPFPADGITEVDVAVQLFDPFGAPIANRRVWFPSRAGDRWTFPAITNSVGVAVGTLATTLAGTREFFAAIAPEKPGASAVYASDPLTIVFLPGEPASLRLAMKVPTTGDTSVVAAGDPIEVRAQALDRFDNVVTTSGVEVEFTIEGGPASFVPPPPVRSATLDGIAQYTAAFTLAGDGYRVRASMRGARSAVTNTIKVVPGRPSKMALLDQPPAEVVAGEPLPPMRVLLTDAYGNPVTFLYEVSVLPVPTPPSLSPWRFQSGVDGHTILSNVVVKRAGTARLKIGESVLSDSFEVHPADPVAAFSSIVFSGSRAAVGGYIDASIRVRDAYGNGVPGRAVTYEVLDGPVQISGAAITDSQGRATARIEAQSQGIGRVRVATPVVAASQEVWFTAPCSAQRGLGWPAATAIGDATAYAIPDVNADGKADLGTTGGIALATGHGRFWPLELLEVSGSTPLRGDLDGDGHEDLASTHGPIALDVARGRSDGTFAPAERWQLLTSTSTGPIGALVSANADRFADVLVGSSGVDYALLLNHGGWSFSAPIRFSVPTDHRIVRVADLNGDALSDLVTENPFDGGIAVIYGAGDGQFAPPLQISGVGESSATVALVADFDGNGRADLAVSADRVQLRILFQSTDGSFSVGPIQQVPTYPSALGADMDRDGDTDVVAVDSASRLTVFLNDGAGLLTRAPGSTHVPADTSAISVDDVDGDSYPDVVISSRRNGALVARNNGDGTLQGATAQRVGQLLASSRLFGEDFTGDGALDLVVVDASSSYGIYPLLVGQPDGTVAAEGQRFWGAVRAAVTADFDGDGLREVAAVFGAELRFYEHAGAGLGLASRLAVTLGYPFARIATLDVEGDGDVDLVLATPDTSTVQTLVNDGSGSFTAAAAKVFGGALAAFVVSAGADAQPAIAFGGDGGPYRAPVFADGTFGARTALASFESVSGLSSANIDGDGVADLVVTARMSGETSASVSVLLSSEDAPRLVPSAPPFVVTAVGDLNGDALADLLWSGEHVRVSFGDGTGRFAPPVTYASDGAASVAPVDFDSDGVLDLWVYTRAGDLLRLRNHCLE